MVPNYDCPWWAYLLLYAAIFCLTFFVGGESKDMYVVLSLHRFLIGGYALVFLLLLLNSRRGVYSYALCLLFRRSLKIEPSVLNLPLELANPPNI